MQLLCKLREACDLFCSELYHEFFSTPETHTPVTPLVMLESVRDHTCFNLGDSRGLRGESTAGNWHNPVSRLTSSLLAECTTDLKKERLDAEYSAGVLAGPGFWQ